MMLKNLILFEILDLLKSKWLFLYAIVLFIFHFIVIYFSAGTTDEILATITNFYLLIIPLYTMIFSIVNLYENIHFQSLVIVRGISRNSIYKGKFLGLFFGLLFGFLFGILPFFLFFIKIQNFFYILFLLVFFGILLHFIFLGVGFLISQFNFRLEISLGVSIILWFFGYIIYDSFIFLIAVNFGDYPLESILIVLLFMNPMDLIRTTLFIQGDLAMLMSYSSAIYLQIFGSKWGIFTGVLYLLFFGMMIYFLGQKKFFSRDL